MLRSERVVLRPGRPDDAERLAAILAEPDVARWWGPQRRDEVLEALARALVIEIGGAPAGWILVEEDDDPDYRSVALDIMVGSDHRGGGYGREALRVAVRHFAARGHHRFTIDPAVDNGARSGRTPPSDSARWASCAPTSGRPTAPGTTTCSWTCSPTS